ncbi:MAG: hypothetical protein OJJ54_15105 [Pseudonocardia sp.]|nr:hypothetical protein [Pseudonocardia sp.]
MSNPASSNPASDTTGRPPVALVVIAWLWVLVPFLYGLYSLVVKIPALFG